MTLFFEPSLRFALMLLDANHRDEAGRFEPLDRGENGAVVQHLPAASWSRYPYTAILVLGVGPEDPNVAISSRSKLECARAAQLFRKGAAPLIIVSGGYVHPSQTRFSRQSKMRHLLIEHYAIPSNVILIDPHARHTTTNFRNADRLIYLYGIPMDRPLLTTAFEAAVDDILHETFDHRNQNDLGYLPYEKKTRVSPTKLAFFPTVEALQADARDPLDP